MTLLRRSIISSVIVLLGVLAALHWTSQKSKAAANAEHLKSIAVVRVDRRDLAREVSFTAELRPYQQTDLHAMVPGYLKYINVDIGDEVKQGEILAGLEVPELRDELARDEADLRAADLDYHRLLEVEKARPGLLAQQDIDNAQAKYEMAKANRERAAEMVAYATIKAPFDGVITHRYVDPGALVQAGTNSNSQALPVVHIAENTVLRLDFPVPEPLVPSIHVGTPVEVLIEATGQKIEGKVARTAGKLDTSTRTLRTEVDIQNTDLRIAPGMYADARVLLEKKDNVLTLPVQAISSGAKPTVWRISPKGKIEEVPVKLGLQTDSEVEIKGGLNQGDEVVFGSRSVASVGQKVQPKLISSL